MSTLYIYDCSSGKLQQSHVFPFSVGNTDDSACHVDMDEQIGGVFLKRGPSISFVAKSPYSVNAEPQNKVMMLDFGKNYVISMGRGLFIARASFQPTNEFAACNCESWYYYDSAAENWAGPLELATLVARADLDDTIWVGMEGLSDGVCSLGELRLMADRKHSSEPQESGVLIPPSPPKTKSSTVSQDQELPLIPEDEGEHTCPTCWLKFDIGDVMNIASHPSLRGDVVLGRDHMKRFHARRFNARGQALDEKGIPCMELACPHCRRKLPPHFLDSSLRVFSIIGAPSSGKSYYLASLVHELADRLPTEFNICWRDSDPVGNSMLNDVTNRLFASASAEQAYLSKTDLEGALYEEFHRHGRMVKLPKPFVYNVSSMKNMQDLTGLVFYDNAGEHFEPGRNSEDSPGARHVAVASGLFFLFDPITSVPFRRFIGKNDDPQFQTGGAQVLDQQNIIMAETAVRISVILNLQVGERLDTPFAVIIGKSDLWEHLLTNDNGDPIELLPIVENGKIVQSNVDANSEVLRRLLMKMHPSLCATADTISSNVRYFAVSQLGCSPITFKDPVSGDEKIGPDPNEISPRHICDPTLWVLSQIDPQLVPSK